MNPSNIKTFCRTCDKFTIPRLVRQDAQDGSTGYHSYRCSNCSPGDSHATSSRPSRPTGHLGKHARSLPTLRTMVEKNSKSNKKQKKTDHAILIRGAVEAAMGSWFKEENDILTETCNEQGGMIQELADDRAALTLALARMEQRNRLLEVQLAAAHRYSRMVAEWIPQVNEMFGGDLDDMIEIQRQQELDLDAETDTDE